MNGEQPPVQPQDELDAQAADAARRVVDGQDVVNNDEYLQHHPNAIQDIDKARFVAYATKEEQERGERKAHDTLDEMSGKNDQLGSLDYDNATKRKEMTDFHYGQLVIAREEADKQIDKASMVYDNIQAMKAGRSPSELPEVPKEPPLQ